MVFWNVPEGSESGIPLTEFIQGILSGHMKLEQMLSQSVEIIRAPRSATNRTSGDSKPRPIHIYLPGAPNDNFLSDPLEHYFRRSGVALKLYRYILGSTVIFLSVRSF